MDGYSVERKETNKMMVGKREKDLTEEEESERQRGRRRNKRLTKLTDRDKTEIGQSDTIEKYVTLSATKKIIRFRVRQKAQNIGRHENHSRSHKHI